MRLSTHLQPNDKFKSYLWRRVLEISPHIEKSATWTLTGTAGSAALMIVNISSIAGTVGNTGLAWVLILLAASLVLGAISKTAGAALTVGLANLDAAIRDYESEDMQSLMAQMTIPVERFAAEIAQPFLWPISLLFKRYADAGTTDPLATEKKFIRIFCYQLYAYWLHALLAIAAIPIATCALFSN